MLLIAGTVPDTSWPVENGRTRFVENGGIEVGGRPLDVQRGTATLVASACMVAGFFGRDTPHAWLAGDDGSGAGSQGLYELLARDIGGAGADVAAFHYILPDADGHGKVFLEIEKLRARPKLVADAGFMYAAKMCGRAPDYDLFTPDAGELAFLADESAPHPFYARGFFLDDHAPPAPELAARAYEHGNAAAYLMVKGRTDMVVDRQGVVSMVDKPVVEALEAVGGTGDIVTGISAGLMEAGLETSEACWRAALAGRLAGALAEANPATQALEIVRNIPQALDEVLKMAYTPSRERGPDG